MTLTEILTQYRAGERELPTYAELQRLAEQHDATRAALAELARSVDAAQASEITAQMIVHGQIVGRFIRTATAHAVLGSTTKLLLEPEHDARATA